MHVHGLKTTDLSAVDSIGVLLRASISDVCFVFDSNWETWSHNLIFTVAIPWISSCAPRRVRREGQDIIIFI